MLNCQWIFAAHSYNMGLVSYVLFLLSACIWVQGAEYLVTDQVAFDMVVGNHEIGTIVLGLFGELCPRTTENFLVLSTKGINGRSYVGSPIHRVINKFMIQGGDIVNGDGTGSISIYGDSFDDENFIAKHSSPGMLSMANSGPNTNGCQFFITTVPTSYLDGKHVVFGKVTQGQNIVHLIEHLTRDSNDRPLKPVYIKRARIIPTQQFWVADSSYNIWEWIKGTSIPLSFSFLILGFFYWIYRKLAIIEKNIDKID